MHHLMNDNVLKVVYYFSRTLIQGSKNFYTYVHVFSLAFYKKIQKQRVKMLRKVLENLKPHFHLS